MVGVNTLGMPGWIGFLVARASPANMKIIGNTISITRVLGSLICTRSFFLSRAFRLRKKLLMYPSSCCSTIE
jgi:hypothetical protein